MTRSTNWVVRAPSLWLISLVLVPVVVVSCRALDMYAPDMVLIEGRVVPCGPLPEDKLVYVEVKSFYIDTTEVTNEAYEKFMKTGGYEKPEYWSKEGWDWKIAHKITAPGYWGNPRFSDPKQPVVDVSYYEAEAYARWADKRLPTEVEWELASRGTDARAYPWYGPFHGLYANTEDYWRWRLRLVGTGLGLMRNDKGEIEREEARPTRVKSFVTDCSPFGCYDMCGNVCEWCQISKEIPFNDNVPTRDDAVIRGGCWNMNGKRYGTLFRRVMFRKDRSSESVGFRCAMTYCSEK